MIYINGEIVKCKNCGNNYDYPKASRIKILSSESFELEDKHRCPFCGDSNIEDV
ncbi:hypothetical protein [Methanobacterium sp.]|uniref:hypothetical protein n=1 Tax=Methanobacterium sp. TaxID=2164 RepID=UPI003C76C8A9